MVSICGDDATFAAVKSWEAEFRKGERASRTIWMKHIIMDDRRLTTLVMQKAYFMGELEHSDKWTGWDNSFSTLVQRRLTHSSKTLQVHNLFWKCTWFWSRPSWFCSALFGCDLDPPLSTGDYATVKAEEASNVSSSEEASICAIWVIAWACWDSKGILLVNNLQADQYQVYFIFICLGNGVGIQWLTVVGKLTKGVLFH